MPNPPKDLTGKVFGYLTVIGRAGSTTWTKKRQATWLLRCVCGARVIRAKNALTSPNRGGLKSCGCRRREMILAATGTHGMTGHPAWVTWNNMLSRCRNPKDKDWRNYGARGIDVCARWAESFANFWEDMGASWTLGMTLDRVDNSGNYEKANCRWATVSEQSNNRRGNVVIQTPNGRMTVAQASREFGVKAITIHKRIERGWPEDQLLRSTTSSTQARRRASS